MQQFQPLQLPYLIASMKHQRFSGVVNILGEVPHAALKRKRILVFHEGWMTYAGDKIITAQELANQLGRKFKLPVMESALQLAKKKIKNTASIHEYLELFVRLELFTWKDLEDYMTTKIIGVLEPLIPYGGTLSQDPANLNLHFSAERPGLRWADLQPLYEKRQAQWSALVPVVPSPEGVPQIVGLDSAPDKVVRHVRQWVNGKHSIVDIAVGLTKDPLELAQLYFQWAGQNWITFDLPGSAQAAEPAEPSVAQGPEGAATAASKTSPIVLSVDDSQVVQTMIKRALNDRYQVVLANNAVDALNALNSHDVSVILLDVTMPDIDGLDLCRTIRSIGKFRELPVIMLTAKDGMFNKLKGQMAGATHYLTKPVSRDKLLEVLNKYVPTIAEV